jgi:hypothetical protein
MKIFVAVVGVALALPLPANAQEHVHADAPGKVDAEFDGKPGSVTGHIRDAACLFRNTRSGAPDTPQALECAQKCVLAGSPLVVFTTDRQIFLILSNSVPDTAQATKLLPYVGKVATVSGRVFERDGLRAIAVEKVDVAAAPGK